MEGLYRVTYSTSDGAQGWLAIEAVDEDDARSYAEKQIARWDGGWAVTGVRWLRAPILT